MRLYRSKACRFLSIAGVGSYCFDQKCGTAQTLHARGVETIVADLNNKDWHQKITPEQNYVVDCVGAAASTLEGYEASYRMGMQSILQWLEGGVRKWMPCCLPVAPPSILKSMVP